MTKNKALLPLFALIFCLGAFLFPVSAYAQAVPDETPTTVTAALSGEILTVTAQDDAAVAAIYIGGYRFTTLIDGTARVRFDDYVGPDDKEAEVYAVDSAGNRSESVMIANLGYVAPTTTPAPIPALTPTPTPVATPTPTPAPIEEAIPDNPKAFTPDGGGTVQDNATEEDGKEFFTVTTAAGNVYYLIIDRQRGTENVYFLSPVTEADLLGLAEGATTTAPGLSQPEPQTPAPAEPTPEPEQPEPPVKSNGPGVGMIIFIVLAAAAIGAVGYYVKIVKPRKDAGQREEYEDEDESEGENGETEYFFENESDDDSDNEEGGIHEKN
jgi:hypothetical protein